MKRLWAKGFAVFILGASSLVATALPSSATTGDVPRYKHVFYIVEENREASQILGNPAAPTLNQLADTYGYATDYYGTSHPSEPNYVAMIGGSDFGIKDDNPYTTNMVDKPSLATQLEDAGLSWKSYSQALPYAGFTGTCYPCNSTNPAALYASKHNPFLNFKSVQSNPAEMRKSVPIEQLNADLAQDTVPTLSFIVPDQCHDMHGTTGCTDATTNVKVADDYAGGLVKSIMSSKTWNVGQNAIVLVFDEGNTASGCCDATPGGGKIYTTVITTNGARAMKYSTPSNHYSMLAALQRMWGLGCLENTCDTENVKPASPMFATE